MQRLARFGLGKVAALVTLTAVTALFFAGGGEMFSPGPLNATSRAGVELGGVASHAQLATHCSACHAALERRNDGRPLPRLPR